MRKQTKKTQPRETGAKAARRELEEEIAVRKRVEKALKRRSEELAAFDVVATVVSQSLDLNTVLDTALENTLAVLNAGAGLIYLFDETGQVFVPVVHRGISQDTLREVTGFKRGIGLSGRVAESGEALVVADLGADPRNISPAAVREGWRSYAGVPIKCKGKVLGVMTLVTDRKRHLGPEHMGLLGHIGNQIGVAIENARLYQAAQHEIAERKRAEEQFLVANARLQYLLSSTSAVIYTARTTGDYGATFISENVTSMVGCEPQEFLESSSFWIEHVHPGDVQRILAELPRIFEQERYAYEYRFRRTDGTYIWVRDEMKLVRDKEGRPLEIIGYWVDITERKQAEEALSRHAAQLALINDIGRRIAAALDLNEVLNRAAGLVQESFGYHHVALFTVDRERGELVMRARAGDFAHLFPLDHRIKLERGIVGWVGRNGERLLANDVSTEPRYVNFFPDVILTRSELSVPIRVSQQTIGVLDVQSPQVNAFDEKDVTVMETLADQIAVAIENARLYEAVRQELGERKWAEEQVTKLNQDLERQARELAALNKAGQMMTSMLDLDSVLGIVMAEVRDLLRAEGASVLLQDRDELVFVASAGSSSADLIGVRIPVTSGIAGWVMREGKAVRVGDARSDLRFYDRIDAMTGLTTHSLLAVPLIVRGVSRGVIEAVNKAESAFDERDLMLLEGIAGSAAIAIENARLFAAVDKELIERERAEAEIRKLNQDLERRATELTALNKAGQAIVSTLDLDTVLQLVLAEVRSLLEVEGAAVFLRVPAQVGQEDELILAEATFRSGVKAAVGARLPITQGIIGSVVESEQAALINNVPGDPRFDKHFCEVTGIIADSLLAVPLRLKGIVEGVIEAVNKIGGAFDEHDLEVLEVIAHSAVTAIQNAQLYGHLKRALQQEQKVRAQLIQAGKLSAMGRMVASVAHEFNNPLQTIKNCLFLIQADVAPGAPGHEFLNMAVSEVQRLSDLVAQLRAVYRPGAVDQVQAVELSKILDQVHSLIAPHLSKNRVQCEYMLPSSAVMVSGIPDQLKQVFLNLGLNASDAMQATGGTLTISASVSADGRQIGVAFRDTGPGVDPRDLPNLFDPFFTTKESGMGLGLAICYDIVQKNGGRIEVESQPGQGATFTVWLPLAEL